MKLSWKVELPQWVLIAAMWLLSAVVWPTLPERVPIHWNLAGEVDGWGGRFTGVLLLPLMAVGLYLLLAFIPRLDPGRANYASFATAYAVIRTAIMAVFAGIHAFTIAWARGFRPSAQVYVMGSVAFLFIVLGGVMGKVRPNWFVGIRTPWTLSSKTAWTKTHRLGGWMFIGAGVVSLLSLPLPPAWTFGIVMSAVGIASLVPIAYSYVVWRTAPDKIPPGGTLPAEDGQT
jgi:uncharacterized membrane protein